MVSVYPVGSLTTIETSQGLDNPREVFVPVNVPPQFPESAMEHEVIGQLIVSVLLKNASHVENPAPGVMETSVPPSV